MGQLSGVFVMATDATGRTRIKQGQVKAAVFLAAMQTSMKTLVVRLLLLKMEKKNRKIGRKQ